MRYLKKTDRELINEIKTDYSDAAYEELVTRHSGVFQRVFQKYERALVSSGINNQEINDDKHQLFVKAIYSYDISKKSQFTTWLGNQVKFHCLNLLTAQSPLFHPSSNEEKEMVENQIGFNPNNSSQETLDFIENLLNQFHDKRIVDIIRYRFLDPDKNHRKWKYICEKLNISSMTAPFLCKKGLKLIKTKMDSKNCQDFI